MDIERGAKCTVTEGRATSVRVTRYKEHWRAGEEDGGSDDAGEDGLDEAA